MKSIPPSVRAWVSAGLEMLNRQIEETLGSEFCIGHSMFMRRDLTDEIVEKIWDHDIGPLLEDYFYDRKGFAAGLRTEFFKLRKQQPAAVA
jgi:5-methylcytosine-specific restriction protein B